MYVLELFDKHNISVVYVAKLEYDSHDEAELDKEFTLMKHHDPRIILSHAISASSIACWLHRAGFVGPQYVLATMSWLAFDPAHIEMPIQWSWCTKEMVLDVAESLIPFGDGLYGDVKTGGPSIEDFYADLQHAVVDATDSDVQDYWLPLYHDRAYAVGLILNHTEAILKQERNETLSDWLTSSENYQKKGIEIVEIIKQASLNLNMVGFKGEYGFKKKDGMVMSKAFLPIVISQIVITNRTDEENVEYDYNNVAFHNMEDGWSLQMMQPLTWRTFNGQPPKDALKVKDVKLPMLPLGLDVTLKAISCVAISMLLVVSTFFIVFMKIDNKFPILSIVVGNLFLLSHSFLIPVRIDLTDSLVNSHCSVMIFLIAIGFCMVISGIRALFRDSKLSKVLLTCWLLVNILIMAVVLGLAQNEMVGESNLMDLDIEYVPNTDFSEAIRPKRWGCVALAKTLTNPDNFIVMALVLFLTAGNFYLLGQTGYDSYKKCIRHRLTVRFGRFKNSDGTTSKAKIEEKFLVTSKVSLLKGAAFCTYCQILILVATLYLVVLQPHNFQYLLTIISLSSFVFVSLNMWFIIFAKQKELQTILSLRKS